jgi:TolB protein
MINAGRCARIVLLVSFFGVPDWAAAQWVNRYPKLDDFGHQIYLEQHELPFLAHGPTDPAPAPDGERLAFSAQGWIWMLDLASGEARRVTDGPALDSRPRWSPGGERIAFVRDSGSDTAVVVRDMRSGRESIIDTPTIDIDPEFSADGEYLFYTSGVGGSLSIWRRHLASGTDERLTDLPQVERNARRLPGGDGIVYLHGDGPHRALRSRDFIAGVDAPLHQNTLTYHLTSDVHPTRRVVVFSEPIENDYHIVTADMDEPNIVSRLTFGRRFALTPSYSADGTSIFFVEPDASQQFRLLEIPAYGGDSSEVDITEWDYGSDVGSLVIETAGPGGELVPARLAVVDASDHPVASPGGPTYFDSQTGRHYFYSGGRVELTLPVGRYSVTAARGPMVEVARGEASVGKREAAGVRLELAPVWDAPGAGYRSADYHVHLNGDGQHRATHDDMLAAIAGEDLDHISPMSWNRWERRIDRPLVGAQTSRRGHTVDQGQEVRSHFHGHIGLLRIDKPFSPWFFGPFNPVLGDPDLTNGDVIAHAEAVGSFATYVHPIGGDADPFADFAANPIPLELVSDSVLAKRIGLEIVCAWTSPLGNSELWYRLLNIGRPVAAMSGTDGWTDFHRTPAMGTARAYVRTGGDDDSFDAILQQAIAGRSFVTTGPALLFEVGDGDRPGDVTAPGDTTWRITLASTVDVDRVEIVVNGAVVEQLTGVRAGQTRTLAGDIALPAGGWVAARAYASEPQADAWPTMALRPFAHSSPVWIGSVGSTDPAARAAAAADLTRAIDFSEGRARAAYGDTAMPRLYGRFDEARAVLATMTGGD